MSFDYITTITLLFRSALDDGQCEQPPNIFEVSFFPIDSVSMPLAGKLVWKKLEKI